MAKNRILIFLQRLENKKGKSFVFWFLLFFCFSILLRLPHFLSNEFWFDGDEALVGILAQDLLTGKNFPVYFYGQSYGLSMFEAFSVAFWIKLIGSSIWALRLGGLTLFALGSTFIFKGLTTRGLSVKLSFFVVLAVLSFPTWSLWGAMVRGGYVTAFTVVSALFYSTARIKFNLLGYVLTGLLLAIGFESHFLLLIPILPLLLMEWMNQKGNWKGLLTTLIFAGISILLFKSVTINGTYWPAPKVNWDFHSYPGRFSLYLDGFFNAFGNYFFYTTNSPIPVVWNWLLIVSFGLIVVVVANFFFSSGKRNKVFIGLTFVGLLFILLFSLTIVHYSPRYLISFFTGLLFLFLFFSREIVSASFIKRILGVILAIFLLGMGFGSFQKRDWIECTVNKVNAFEDLHKEVAKRNKQAVFVTDNLMQWQWNYLYGNEIPANGFRSVERTMRFTLAVDSIYKLEPQNTAIIGSWGLFYGIDFIEGFNNSRKQIATDYFIQPIVNEEFHDQGYKQMGEIYKR